MLDENRVMLLLLKVKEVFLELLFKEFTPFLYISAMAPFLKNVPVDKLVQVSAPKSLPVLPLLTSK